MFYVGLSDARLKALIVIAEKSSIDKIDKYKIREDGILEFEGYGGGRDLSGSISRPHRKVGTRAFCQWVSGTIQNIIRHLKSVTVMTPLRR